MRPQTESLKYLNISDGTSKDFNKLVQSIGSDITSVFTMANENEKSTERNAGIVIQENLFLQRKIKELEDKLTSIEQTIANKASNNAHSVLYKTLYTMDGVESTDKQIYHDASYGIVTLPHSSTQKIPLTKYPREFLQKNMDIKVDVQGTVTDMTNDPTLLNIIDPAESSFWVKTIETDNNTSYVDFSVTINMPLRMLPSLSINSIGIKPHPMYSLTLMDVTYINASNGTELRLPTFPVDSGNPMPLQAIDNAKFMFPTISTSSIRFNFRQPYYLQDGDKRTFVIGLRNIDLENIGVTNEEASFITTFKIPGENRFFLRVEEPSVTTLHGEDYGDSVSHELYYDRSGVTPFSFGSDIIADIDTVYIKTTIRRTGDIIPVIKGIKLQYLSK